MHTVLLTDGLQSRPYIKVVCRECKNSYQSTETTFLCECGKIEFMATVQGDYIQAPTREGIK